ncbi:Uncharacterised protein [Chlamydia trachomatis]|nr:Uncharacterised protein [Chlamydia trachomatis]
MITKRSVRTRSPKAKMNSLAVEPLPNPTHIPGSTKATASSASFCLIGKNLSEEKEFSGCLDINLSKESKKGGLLFLKQ